MEKEYSQKYLQIQRGRGVIFNSPETPFSYVRPELSDLGISISLGEKIRTKFPMLNFSKACIVDGAIIIQDLSALDSTTQRARLLNIASDITLQVIDAKSATNLLLKLLAPYQTTVGDSLVVFPGEGARTMRQFIQASRETEAVFLPTKRSMVKPGEFDLSVDYSSLPVTTKSSRVIIFDDVVATGQTVTTIARDLRRMYSNLTECIVATWVMVEPQSDALSGLEGIDQVFTSMVVKGNYVKAPPINSLSCFIRNYGQYEAVKRTFIQKYIRDENLFNTTLRELGGDRCEKQ